MVDIMADIIANITMGNIIPMSIIKKQKNRIKEESEHHRDSLCLYIFTKRERR
jgi:hypothetical protein